MTQAEKLLKTLRTGKELTAQQIKQLGIAHPYSTIRDLRQKHMISVYSNKRTLKNGKTVTKYRIGTPTAAMQAAGYTA